MSKKNNLTRRKKQHTFDLQREKDEREKTAMRQLARSNKMKVDVTIKKKKSTLAGFKRKAEAKLTAMTKAKASQAMEICN